MALSTPEIISGIALLATIGNYLWSRFGLILDLKGQIDKLATEVAKLQLQVNTLWPVVTDSVKNLLMHPTESVKDDLLTRFPDLTDEELHRLDEILTKERDELIPNSEYADARTKTYIIALGLMLAGVRTLIVEREG